MLNKDIEMIRLKKICIDVEFCKLVLKILR